jgi:hypothetical protein
MNSKTIKSIERHVREGVYFATTATILDLQRQELAKLHGHRRRMSESLECLGRMRDELMYLQEHYRIIRRRAGS